MLDSEHFFDWFVGIILVGGFLSLAFVSCRENYEEKMECSKHGGKPYAEEIVVTHSSSLGCQVTMRTQFTQDCKPYDTIYFTECPCRITVSDGKKMVGFTVKMSVTDLEVYS